MTKPLTLCKNETCPLRMRCKRFTDAGASRKHYKPHRAGNAHVCDEYRFNGQTFIK